MKTLIISQDGTCLEFKKKGNGQPDKFVNICSSTNTVAIWSATPPALKIVGFESFDIGTRTATGRKVLFLRGNTLLLEIHENMASSNPAALQNLAEFFEGDIPPIHNPVHLDKE